MTRQRGTILVVDDDRSFLKAVLRLIRTQGYDVCGTETLAEFEAELPKCDPECVLADIVLRGESGLSIPEILKQHNSSVPVIFMSATDERSEIETAGNLGVVPCLRKPIEASELFSAIDVALQSPKISLIHDTRERN